LASDNPLVRAALIILVVIVVAGLVFSSVRFAF
jgi:hypothetical protein